MYRRWYSTFASAFIMLAAAACGNSIAPAGGDADGTSSFDIAHPTTTAAHSALAITKPAGTASAPAPSVADGWGPLAVTDISSYSFGRTAGVLRITEACTYVETSSGESYLLVWPSGRTTWDPERRRIIFENTSGEISELEDGQRIELGGGADARAGPEASESEGVRNPSWAASPHPSCSASVAWWVGGTISTESSASRRTSWGPLAVVPPSNSQMEARLEGTLQITDECALVESGRHRLLLLWPADRTTWDSAEQAVTLEDLDGTSVTWGKGSYVVLSGGGVSAAERGVAEEEWLAHTPWVAEPSLNCQTTGWWIVGQSGE